MRLTTLDDIALLPPNTVLARGAFFLMGLEFEPKALGLGLT